MSTVTPEAYLRTLIRRLKAVDAATTYLPEQDRKELSDDIQHAMRDCQMTSLLHDHTVIAVAGDQGAGKTMLVRLLYNLDNTWLNDNPGRGERLPTLVVEDPHITAPQGCLYRWMDDTDPAEPRGELVNPDAFHAATRTWTPKALALPVLRVPKRYFGGARHCGFLLLPGYEKRTETNGVWQDFMRLALVAASACVLVTNAGLLAQQQDAIRSDLQKNQLQGVKPAIVITGTEAMPLDRQEELRRAAAERFDVPLDCTLCTGTGNQTYVEQWQNELLGVLGERGGIGQAARERQLGDLEEMSRQVGIVVRSARTAVRTHRAEGSEKEDLRQDILDTLDEAIERVRGDYEKELTGKLNAVRDKARDTARVDFNDKETGWIFTDALNWIGRRSHIKADRRQELLRSAVERSGGGAAFAATHATLLADLSRQRLPLPEPAGEGLPGVPGLVPSEDPTYRSLGQLRKLLSHRPSTEAKSLSGRDAQELKQAIRLLPAIATSYMSAMQSLVTASSAHGTLPAPDLPDVIRNIPGTMVEMHGLTASLLKATATVLAIDIAVDGSAVTIPAFFNEVAKILGGSGTVLGSTATAMAGPVSLAVGAAVVAYAVIGALDRQQASERAELLVAIVDVFREQRNTHLAQFDEVMSWMKRRVSDQLEIALRLDEGIGQRLRAILAIDDLWETRTIFLDELRAADA